MKNKFICILLLISLFSSVTVAITCAKKHRVYGGETCKSIAKNGHISLTNFYKWNPSFNCTSIHVGQYVCLSADLTTATTTKTTATKSMVKSNMPTIQPSSTKSVSTTKNIAKTTSTPSPTPTNVPGLTAVVLDEARFCLFLPSSPGNKNNYGGQIDPEAIADSEKDAKTFCTKANLTPGSQLMPQGFITSAHYQFNTTAGFVQVVGDIDRTKYSLSKSDGGGQYDNHGAGSPPLSMCQGYRYYVSLIEPDIQGFCIRCCMTYQDCNASRSAYGCKRVVPSLDFSV